MVLNKIIGWINRQRYQKDFQKYLFLLLGLSAFIISFSFFLIYPVLEIRLLILSFLLLNLFLLFLGYKVILGYSPHIDLQHAHIPYMITCEKGKPLAIHPSFLNFFPKADKCSIQELMEDYLLEEPLTLLEGEKRSKFIIYEENGQKIHCVLKRFTLHNKQQWLWIVDQESAKYQALSKAVYQQNDFLKQFQIREIFDLSPAGIVFLDTEGNVRVYNSTFIKELLKNQKIEVGIPFIELIDAHNRPAFNKALQSFLAGEQAIQTVELKFISSPDSPTIAYMGALNYRKKESEDKLLGGVALYIFDNREQKRIQLHLMQSKKLQAMGQLAGGIAHDFNNLLTAMIGFCDLILSRHSPADQSFTDIMQIKQNANRAANLVRQLLAFSRQQTLQPKVLDIIEALANLNFLLQRLVGSSIKLKMLYGRELGLVKVDQGQFEQVMINLVVNARDAIGEQGEITIKTSNKTIKSPHHIGHETILPGSYVLIDVLDTGHGIAKEYLPQIFDPFFSTKEMGSGTGLGLSTVYGIVKQTGGYVIVESEPGKGTKFSIYLPQYKGKEVAIETEKEHSPSEMKDLTGQGTILLVEDEDAVRLFSKRALVEKGYKVIEARSGEEALSCISSSLQNDKIDLLITDVVMPQMDGPTLVRKAQKILPNLKVIYMSGYAEDSFRRQLDQEQNINFLAKPFNLKLLAEKVKEVLDELSFLNRVEGF